MPKPSRSFKELEQRKEEKPKPSWAGAQSLLTSEPGKEKEKNLIIWTARALNISPFGVNILGNLPYLNKLGLMQKAEEYYGKVKFEYRWIQIAKNDTDKSICECRMMSKDGKPLTDFILGECSPSTIRMSTLKGYTNHMAQTRARNRAIMEACGIQIHTDLIAGIEKLQQEKAINSQSAEKIIKGSQTSFEEMDLPDKKPIGVVQQNKDTELKALFDYAIKKGATLGQEKEWIEKTIGHTVNWDEIDLAKSLSLKTELLLKGNQNGK